MLIKISANSPVRTHSLQNKHAREFLRGSYLDNFQCFHQVESTTSFQSWSNTKTAYKISCPKRFSWSSFVICFLKSTFRYVNTNIQFFLSFSLWQIIFLLFTGYILHLDSSHFSDLAPSRATWKGLFYSFKFNLKNRGVLIFTHYQYF